MNMLRQFWNDEFGVILSAETVMVGTVCVLGVGAGLQYVGKSVNEELRDVAIAIRSLDQSYSFVGRTSCGASTAGSCFQQKAVALAIEELCAVPETPPRPTPINPGQAIEPTHPADVHQPVPNDLPPNGAPQNEAQPVQPPADSSSAPSV